MYAPRFTQIVALDKYILKHDWVMWLDCDSLVMDSNITIESIIWSALSAAEDPENVHVIISEDGAAVNTGVLTACQRLRWVSIRCSVECMAVCCH